MAHTSEFERACQRGQAEQAAYGADRAKYDARTGWIVVSLSSGKVLRFQPRVVPELTSVGAEQLAEIILSPSRLGLYFPLVDVDVSIPDLMRSVDGERVTLSRQR